MVISQVEVVQRQSMHYNGPINLLQHILTQLAGPVESLEDKKLCIFGCIDLTLVDKCVTLEWIASPVNDMYADKVLAAVLQAESAEDVPKAMPSAPSKMDRMHFKECLMEMLQDMFGEDSVPKIFKGDKLHVTVDGKKADIDLEHMVVLCEEDELLQQVVQTAVSKLYNSLSPPKVDT